MGPLMYVADECAEIPQATWDEAVRRAAEGEVIVISTPGKPPGRYRDLCTFRAGGKPNPGTAPDKRLTENKPKPTTPKAPVRPAPKRPKR